MTWGQAKISLKGHKNHYKNNKVGFIKIKTLLSFKKMYKQIIDEKYLQTFNRGYTYIFVYRCMGVYVCMYVYILRKQIHMHIHPGYIKNFHNSIVKRICNTIFLRFGRQKSVVPDGRVERRALISSCESTKIAAIDRKTLEPTKKKTTPHTQRQRRSYSETVGETQS